MEARKKNEIKAEDFEKFYKNREIEKDDRIEIDFETMKTQTNKFFSYCKKTLTTLGYDLKEIMVSKNNIIELIELIEKRRIYFRVFYNCDMNELNEAALFCFWILKLQPFRYDNKDDKDDIERNTINIKIALCIFLHMINFYVGECNNKITKDNKETKKKKIVNITDDIVSNLLYSFRYRDLSKEALMSLALTLIYEVDNP